MISVDGGVYDYLLDRPLEILTSGPEKIKIKKMNSCFGILPGGRLLTFLGYSYDRYLEPRAFLAVHDQKGLL